MRKFVEEYPETYQEFKRGLFVVKTIPGSFRAKSPDMRLEQTIQRSKTSPDGNIGQTRKLSYVSEWELVYHEMLAISNSFSDIIQPDAIKDIGAVPHHELKGSYSSQINISIERVAEFLERRGNPFQSAALAPHHILSTGEMVPQEVTDIGFFSHGNNEYENFRKERFIDKDKHSSDTIHKVNLAKFSSVEPKTKTASRNIRSLNKKLGEAQKLYDIALSRGMPIEDILHFDITMESCLFTDDDFTEKPNKYEIVKELRRTLTTQNTHSENSATLKQQFARLQMRR